jgi:uncharacterized protein YjbI with pentapeptide repeats
MGNPDHIQLLGRGQEAVRQWRRAHPGQYLDCSGATLKDTILTDCDLTGIDFSKADLTGANLQRATLTEASLVGTNLSNALLALANLERANLSNSNLEGANLSQANLTAATLSMASLHLANLTNVTLTNATVSGTEFNQADLFGARLDGVALRSARLAGAMLRQVDVRGIDLEGCDLTSVNFENSILSGARLSNARLTTARFASSDLSEAIIDDANLDEAQLQGANLQGASLVRTSLRRATLQAAKLISANFSGADFFESNASVANFDRSRGLTEAKNLQTVRLTGGDALNFDTIAVPFSERVISWERIRFLGRLPLFGASYIALVAIPIFFYLLDFFNKRVDLLRAWAYQEAAAGGISAQTAKAILQHLHREAIPSLSLLLFFSTILLGAGATIFALACPSRIREFSRDQWCDEINRSLIHYWSYSWQHRPLRLVCVLFYGLGAIGALTVLTSKLWNVFWFIIENS